MAWRTFAVAALVGAGSGAMAQEAVEQERILGKFEDFIAEHKRRFVGAVERQARLAAFAENLRFVEAENAKGTNSYRLGLTQFADMTNDHFRQHYCGYRRPAERMGGLPHLGTFEESSTPPPESIDWRQEGAVTPVKNQGQCGSCWSFSTTGAVEGAWKIASGLLVSMSEQQLVDCAEGFGEAGCNGGDMDSAFKYVHQYGLDTEQSYAYKAKQLGHCEATEGRTGIPAKAVTGYKDVRGKSEMALMQAVAMQPVSIAIEADKQAFQLYRSGILDTPACGTQLDHGVLVVGYGTEDGQDYWIVKNSWGPAWGEQGYIRLARGVAGAGQCGILSEPSFPVVSTELAVVAAAGRHAHYGRPPCNDDEVTVQVQGMEGVMCSPKCQDAACPVDVPPGTTATPQCALQDQSGDKYCALACTEGGCPEGARCQLLGTSGICMFDADSRPTTVQLVGGGASVINV
mmetsp:Transcript_120340/g.236501  ORF Transcript_120340/g.236501 Transcript_120340/m.236501 type:complete len:459 (+) Transcript_120340:66-1442(+)